MPGVSSVFDRARLGQANRLFETAEGPLNAEALSRIEAEDISASLVFNDPPGRDDASTQETP